MSDAVIVAVIVAATNLIGQVIQIVLHKKHEKITKDTNAKVNGGLIASYDKGYTQGKLDQRDSDIG